jgi:isopenicillin N synthase-like dioxygenase
MTANTLPVIDIEGLAGGAAARTRVAAHIAEACRTHGFFYITGHAVDAALIGRLENLSRQFFALPAETKLRWPMNAGGAAWRGYFPLGGELTSGRPDWKEGLYLGSELGDEHPLVLARTPMHGRNLFPDVPGLRQTILDYIDSVTAVGHRVLEGIALSLGLEAAYFADRYTTDPLILFRLFNYPSQPVPAALEGENSPQWGVGEHTDYGLLTLLHQDQIGGLQVRTAAGWIEATPLPGSFVCNIGDMLDRMTGGFYRSTPHRVRRNTSGQDRLSFPLFFDPNFNARVRRIDGLPAVGPGDDSASRWDKANVHAFNGTYGDYLLAKVGKVFPDLRSQVG